MDVHLALSMCLSRESCCLALSWEVTCRLLCWVARREFSMARLAFFWSHSLLAWPTLDLQELMELAKWLKCWLFASIMAVEAVSSAIIVATSCTLIAIMFHAVLYHMVVTQHPWRPPKLGLPKSFRMHSEGESPIHVYCSIFPHRVSIKAFTDVWWLRTAMVRADRQRRGIARALLEPVRQKVQTSL